MCETAGRLLQSKILGDPERSVHIINTKPENVKGYDTPTIRALFQSALDHAMDAVRAGEDLRVRISDSNSKMGAVASVSLLPLLTCPARCNGSCSGLCYASKIANLRPAVRKAYAINTALAICRPDVYWSGIDYVVKGVRWFRFHVSGDILDYAYLEQMVIVARNNPHCQILCFTKRYELINKYLNEGGEIPNNLHILFSGWDDLLPDNPYSLPETNVILKGKAAKDNWLLCGGNCFDCACRGVGCWQAKNGDVIAFHQH